MVVVAEEVERVSESADTIEAAEAPGARRAVLDNFGERTWVSVVAAVAPLAVIAAVLLLIMLW